MKKTLAILLTLVMVFLMIPMTAFAAGIGSVDAGYTPDADAIPVSSVAEFEAMGEGKSYYLTQDIDFGGKTYNGYVIQYPNFILDGCGNSVTGFKVNKGTKITGAGLFGEPTADTVVKNLVIGSASTPISITGGGGSSGVLYQAVKNRTTIENVKAYGTVLNSGSTGGIVGYVSTPEINIIDCEFNGTATATKGSAGGIVGYLKKSSKVNIINCVNNANILNNDYSSVGCGGIVGYTNTNINFEGCVNNGNITANGTHAAGILAMIDIQLDSDTINIKNCSNYGKITANYTGKNNSGYSKDINVDAGIGGIFGATRKFKWNYNNTLNIDGCMNYGSILTNGASAGAIMGKGVNSESQTAVFKINVRNCGNLGSVIYGNTSDPVGAFVGGASTNMTGSFIISNCFNMGTTNSTNAVAAVYNLNGDPDKGDTNLTDFYYLEGNFSSAANAQNVKISNAISATADQFASGEIAFSLGFAFGQKLGTDTYPVVGGPVVSQLEGSYINLNTLSADADGSAAPYIQTTEAVEGKQAIRFIIAVDANELDSVATTEMTITFKKTGAEDLTYSLKTGELKLFKSVIADSDIYLAADGAVLLGARVDGVIVDAWESVSVELSIKDEVGNNITSMCVSATYTK